MWLFLTFSITLNIVSLYNEQKAIWIIDLLFKFIIAVFPLLISP